MTDFDTRLRRLEDREQIRALVGAYSLAIDDRDFARLGECFTHDAIYGRDADAFRLEGRSAIVASMSERLNRENPSFHVNHDSFVEWDAASPDHATGLVLCHAETAFGGEHKIAAIRYRDRYRREADGWRIAERRLQFLYYVGIGDYAGILTRVSGIRPEYSQ